jgi:hypothetical protein
LYGRLGQSAGIAIMGMAIMGMAIMGIATTRVKHDLTRLAQPSVTLL